MSEYINALKKQISYEKQRKNFIFCAKTLDKNKIWGYNRFMYVFVYIYMILTIPFGKERSFFSSEEPRYYQWIIS